MAEKQNIPQNDEVDLGNLFKIIGKGFKNFIQWRIAGFLSWLFHLLVQLLIFVRKQSVEIRFFHDPWSGNRFVSGLQHIKAVLFRYGC